MGAAPIATCLWFDGCAREAAEFYAATFPDCQVTTALAAPSDNPSTRAGQELTVSFTLRGQHFIALNGGPHFHFSEAVSFQILTETQTETDRLWSALTENGGQESQCGWCKDRFGLSWQIIPRALHEGLSDPDPGAAARVMTAMLAMTRIDIAAIEAARNGA